MEVSWIPFELHPDTPAEGILLADRFGTERLKVMRQDIQETGNLYGLRFAPFVRMPNTHLALLAAEEARKQGRLDEFHHRVMDAYFAEGRDISDHGIIMELAGQAGLEKGLLRKALQEPDETPLTAYREQAAAWRVGAIPTFLVNQRDKVVGSDQRHQLEALLRVH